jgi:hypothetical protein
MDHSTRGASRKASSGVNTSATTQCEPLARPSEPDVHVGRSIWWDEYVGTKARLIEAGLARDGDFPGDPGRGKVSCAYKRDGTPVRRGNRARDTAIRISRAGKRFVLIAYVDEAEHERRRAAAKARDEARAEALKAEAEVKRVSDELAELPATGEQFAERAANVFWAGFWVFFAKYSGSGPGDSGYWFNSEDREIFRDLADRLYWEIRGAEPCFDAQRRMRKLNEARAKAAKADLPLQDLLSRVDSSREARRTTPAELGKP